MGPAQATMEEPTQPVDRRAAPATPAHGRDLQLCPPRGDASRDAAAAADEPDADASLILFVRFDESLDLEPGCCKLRNTMCEGKSVYELVDMLLWEDDML